MQSIVDFSSKLCEWPWPRIVGGSNDVYSVKRLKQKLQDKYKDFIFFAEVQGRKNVVYLRNVADFIINDKWYEAKKQNIQDKSLV